MKTRFFTTFLRTIVFSSLVASFLVALAYAQSNQMVEGRQMAVQILKSREIDLKGCIQTILKKEFVIKTREEFLSSIRSDASREYCLNNIEKIDFETHSLLGININSGYCRRPVGLKFDVEKVQSEKIYRFNVSYSDPMGSVCRALSQYDLWVLVPKIPDGFNVKFEAAPRPRME